MFIDVVPNRDSPPAVLLREAYRDEHGRPQKRTLGNLSKLPWDVIEALKALLKGGTLLGGEPKELSIERSLPHGHVAAVLGMIRKIALDRLILSRSKNAEAGRYCDLIVAMMVDRLIAPRSKLGFVRAVDQETATTSLGDVLGLGHVREREAYEALDWLLARQARIENGLAKRHLKDGMLVLYDVTSSYFEGHHCPLAQYGHSRDRRSDRLQIVYGLLCTRQGLPIAIEVFEGNAADPTTLKAQIDKLKGRFGITRIVMIGDRGMITKARIRDDLVPSGLDWITCLRAPQIQALAQEGGPLQLSLFDERDLAEITSPDFPGERLIVCRNRELAKERARKRQALLLATEKELLRVQAQVRRKGSHLRTAGEIGLAVGEAVNAKKMAKHFALDIRDGHFAFARKGRADRGRSQARWHLCHPDRRAGRGSQRCACGPGVQRSLSGRAGVPLHEDRRSRDPPHSALECRSRAGPCLSVHARLSCRMAFAPGAGPALVPRHRSRWRARRALFASGVDRALASRADQEGDQAQRQRRPRQ